MEAEFENYFLHYFVYFIKKLQPSWAIGGFHDSGLHPIDKGRVLPKCTGPSSDTKAGTDSTASHIRRLTAAVKAVSPEVSPSTSHAINNSKSKQVQTKIGEVLTREESIERLRMEGKERNRKLKAKREELAVKLNKVERRL